MNYLNLEEILFMHYRVLAEYGHHSNDFIVLNSDRLEYLLNALKQSSGEMDVYSKAATLTKSLISEAHFTEGNKLVGIVAGIIFMLNNGFNNYATDDDIYEATIKISAGVWEETQIEAWFKEHFFTVI